MQCNGGLLPVLDSQLSSWLTTVCTIDLEPLCVSTSILMTPPASLPSSLSEAMMLVRSSSTLSCLIISGFYPSAIYDQYFIAFFQCQSWRSQCLSLLLCVKHSESKNKANSAVYKTMANTTEVSLTKDIDRVRLKNCQIILPLTKASVYLWPRLAFGNHLLHLQLM